MIGLVDCNNFYVSCERVFRPDLEGKPVIVLSNNDGCAISISDEAKALGIKMAEPVHLAEAVIRKNNITMFSSNYILYGDMSDRVMRTIESFIPNIEVYSIDEAFMDLENVPDDGLENLARKIKSAVKQFTGIPVSIGIAPTKTLAKMANRFAKKTKKKIGVHVMSGKNQIDEVLTFTKVGEVWGIGAQHAQRLQGINVLTAADFIKLPDEWVRKHMTVVGLKSLKEMRGERCIDWQLVNPKKKGFRTSRSFGKPVTEKTDLCEAVSNFAANCAKKLREENSSAGIIEVWIETNPYRFNDRQYARSIKMRMEAASNDSSSLIKQALKGLDLIYLPGYLFMKAGVMVSELVPAGNTQQQIFNLSDNRQNVKVMHAMDAINNLYGRNTVRMAAQGYARKWRLKAEKLSPCYTTDINHIPSVKCHV